MQSPEAARGGDRYVGSMKPSLNISCARPDRNSMGFIITGKCSLYFGECYAPVSRARLPYPHKGFSLPWQPRSCLVS